MVCAGGGARWSSKVLPNETLFTVKAPERPQLLKKRPAGHANGCARPRGCQDAKKGGRDETTQGGKGKHHPILRATLHSRVRGQIRRPPGLESLAESQTHKAPLLTGPAKDPANGADASRGGVGGSSKFVLPSVLIRPLPSWLTAHGMAFAGCMGGETMRGRPAALPAVVE